MVLSRYPRIWLGVFDYFVGSGLKGNICVYACMFPCMLCFVMFCMFCMYIVCIYIYMYIFICMYICMCVYIYIYVYSSVLLSMYVLVHIFFLGCYLSIWHCYLSSILAFSFEIVKLNTTTDKKSSTQVIKNNLGNMNSYFLL